MVNKKEQIKKELSPYFPEWTKDFQDFLIWQNYGILEPETPDYGLWDAMEYTYATLLKSMIRISGIKDHWEGPEYLPLAVKAGLEVYFRSEKLECPFHFGTDELGFFLSANPIYTEYIRKTDDRFWFLLAELTPQDKKQDLSSNKKCGSLGERRGYPGRFGNVHYSLEI